MRKIYLNMAIVMVEYKYQSLSLCYYDCHKYYLYNFTEL